MEAGGELGRLAARLGQRPEVAGPQETFAGGAFTVVGFPCNRFGGQ
jgi:hypothetical protein